MKSVISTPFGNFEVKQNDKPVEFNCMIKNYSSNKSSALIRLYVIEVEAKEQDSLICGFDKPIFENLNKDEHSMTLFVENETLVLGLCSINPNKRSYVLTTNNEYGFTYKEEKKITLILCCIEKDKFKDGKKVIEKAIRSEIETTMNIKITNKKKTKKPLIVIALFILLTLIYMTIAFFLVKYKVVGNETLKKIGFGIAGVMLVAIALPNLSVPKETKKTKKTKTTFLISLLLLLVILVFLGITAYILLCSIGIVKNEMILGIGLITIVLVILCWFTSEYKIENSDSNLEVKKKEKREISNIIENPMNPIVLKLSFMFPKVLKEDFLKLIKKLSIDTLKVSEITTTYQLTRETVEIPYRIELEEQEINNLTQIEKQMLFCIYTRHHDGHIREKYIKKLLEQELQEWEFPFLLKLSEEYVYEILAILYNSLKKKENKELKEFMKNNKELLCQGYSKMVDYWNRFYKNQNLNFHNYIGRKLFYECFEYTRKYEKKHWKCACCGNKTIFGYFIHYYNEPCPVCHWQNNNIQNNNPKIEGVNKISLIEARKNYQKMGAIKEEYISLVRKPTDKEKVKLNLDQILKLLKKSLINYGFIRNDKNIFEYKKMYFRVRDQEDRILIEKSKEENTKNSWETVEKIGKDLDNKLLVEKLAKIMIRASQNKKSKKLTKMEKDKIVEEEINDWNPLGLIKNNSASKEEYRLEIRKITTKLSKIKTEKELKEQIESVFQKLFGENLFMNKKKEIEEVTNKIWERIYKK